MLVDQVIDEQKQLEKSGARTAELRRLSARRFHDIRDLPKFKIFRACEQLLDKGYTLIPFDWAFRIQDQFVPTDFRRFEYWLSTYVDDWGKCDDFCTHALGAILYKFPTLTERTDQWAASENRWVRRASAVALIYSLRRKKGLTKALHRARRLLTDEDDLVRKGCGWMLKEAANHYEDRVFDFVMKNKKAMPRVSLRYTIEKMPKSRKNEAMKKDW